MTKLYSMALLVAFLGMPALAHEESVHVLVNLKVEKMAGEARLLKRYQGDSSERILVGIPAEITLPDACTKFVGQESRTLRLAWMRVATSIEAKGAKDPMSDACIAVAVSPIHTELIVEFNVKTDARDRDSLQMVQIGSHYFRVKLNAGRGTVEISHILR